jgi:hypothetical protein
VVFVEDEVERVGAASDVDVAVKPPMERRQVCDDVDDQLSTHRRLVAVAAERVSSKLELVLDRLRRNQIWRFSSRLLFPEFTNYMAVADTVTSNCVC